MQKNRDIAPLTMNSSEVKYLNFVRWEVTGSSQDCITVCNFIWKRVRAAKISVGISILIGIISDVYVMPPTKCRTVTWLTVNCKRCIRHHAFKWCKPFFIQEREDKRLGSRTVSIHERWKAITKGNVTYPPIENLTIIPRERVEYRVGYNHLISNKREWNNCFIKNAHKISRILSDFFGKNNRFSGCFFFLILSRRVQSRTVAYSYRIWRAWYNYWLKYHDR